MTPYNIKISDVHHFKEHIVQCERLNLVCNYDSGQVLPEMSQKLAKGLYDNEQTVISILNYTREKYADIIDCDLICGILVAYKQRPIVFMKNDDYKEQPDDSLFYCNIQQN